MPSNDRYRRDAGTGPVEFIQVANLNPNLLLAGSISGGLFYSDNGGMSGIIQGLINGIYSGCNWASLHPTNSKIWIACSTERDNNGQPGRIGKKGGVMRTLNGGESWNLIGNYMDFIDSPDLVIYKTCFPSI